MYTESGSLAPGVMLRSLGGGWTLNELMGLVCTKRHLSKLPNPPGCLLSSWIPLDHHTDWFGGATAQKRADLLWLTVFQDDERRVNLMLTVVESKFGKDQRLGPKGAYQVEQTLAVINNAFDVRTITRDGRFWRESLVRAIESAGVIEGDTLDQSERLESSILPQFIRNQILGGQYQISPRDPRVVWHDPSSAEDSESDQRDLKIEHVGKDSILRYLTIEEPFPR